ncbi:MAG: hypothetical protein JO284_06790 [Planctomycetaceae bacterium]|nr:hypothetical protein [Planctomycetaceae bacterium]
MAKVLHEEGKVGRVLVVDFDAHQSNGTAAVFQGCPWAAILDLYALLSRRRRDGSIREGRLPHRSGLALGVHQDPVPAMPCDGLVVGMPDSAPDVHPGVAPHDPPARRLPFQGSIESVRTRPPSPRPDYINSKNESRPTWRQ